MGSTRLLPVMLAVLLAACAAPVPSPSVAPGASAEPSPSIGPGPSAAPSPSVQPDPSGEAVPSVEPTPSPSVDPTPSAEPSPSVPPEPGRVRVDRDVAMTPRLRCLEFVSGCINLVDIYYPSQAGPWPVIVTIHGRPRTRTDMAPIARELASRGAVVFNADYRGVRPVAKGFPESINDVSCAIRFARAAAADYGGDGERVVLVGHSQGGYVGSLVSLSGDRFVGQPGDCLADEGGVIDREASVPEGFVHVAGVSITDPDLRLNWIYFGGSPEQKPEAWRRGEILNHIGRNPDLVVGIIFQRDDPILGDLHAISLHRALRDADYDVRLRLMDRGNTHFDILEIPGLGEAVVRMVEDIVERTR